MCPSDCRCQIKMNPFNDEYFLLSENINFTALSHCFKTLKVLTTDLNPNQNISYAEIINILPSLNQLEIESPDLNIEQQNWILNDFKLNKFNYLKINSEIYSFRLENLNKQNKKENNPCEMRWISVLIFNFLTYRSLMTLKDH